MLPQWPPQLVSMTEAPQCLQLFYGWHVDSWRPPHLKHNQSKQLTYLVFLFIHYVFILYIFLKLHCHVYLFPSLEIVLSTHKAQNHLESYPLGLVCNAWKYMHCKCTFCFFPCACSAIVKLDMIVCMPADRLKYFTTLVTFNHWHTHSRPSNH